MRKRTDYIIKLIRAIRILLVPVGIFTTTFINVKNVDLVRVMVKTQNQLEKIISYLQKVKYSRKVCYNNIEQSNNFYNFLISWEV